MKVREQPGKGILVVRTRLSVERSRWLHSGLSFKSEIYHASPKCNEIPIQISPYSDSTEHAPLHLLSRGNWNLWVWENNNIWNFKHYFITNDLSSIKKKIAPTKRQEYMTKSRMKKTSYEKSRGIPENTDGRQRKTEKKCG